MEKIRKSWIDPATKSMILMRPYIEGCAGWRISILTTVPLTKEQKRELHANDALQAATHVVDKMKMIPAAKWEVIEI